MAGEYKKNKSFDAKLQAMLGQRVMKAAFYIESVVKQLISKPTRSLGPSSPGNPPHADTGRLRLSIGTAPRASLSSNVVSAAVGAIKGAGAPYAKYLEFGTAKMAPRPFFRPAIKMNKKKILQIFIRG